MANILPANWGPPKPLDNITVPSKPAKGTVQQNPYGHSVKRLSDHAVETPGRAFLVSDYSRRQAFNCDNSMILLYGDQGFWHLYDAHTFAHLKQLTGLAGDDCEPQWHPTNPHTIHYMDNTGGTKIYALDVVANTSTVKCDFTTAIHALFPSAVRCWTKSEGSPSADGVRWGLMAETSSYTPLGYFVIDIEANSIIWSMPNSVRPDHVSITPCGRWFTYSGDEQGTKAIRLTDNLQRSLHHKSEHSDLGLLPDGTSFYTSIDFQTNGGDVFVIYIETGVRKVLFEDYGNPWGGSDYSMHISAKCFHKPGYALYGQYDQSQRKNNVVIGDVVNGKLWGLGTNYAIDNTYYDESHPSVNRELTMCVYSDNYGTSGDEDAYICTITAGLPNA